jgi:predicted glycosyltransferase
MRILIDLGHPAHVHLFRNLYFKLISEGHFVIITTKDIPIAKKLLELYGIPYINLGQKSDGLVGKFFDLLRFGWKIYRLVKRNKIEMAIGTSINIAHVSRFTKISSFVFDDDDSAVQPLMKKYGHPFADFIVSPDVLDFERKAENHITYPAYHELAYLHPQIFEPDTSVLRELGIKEEEKYFILRFNAFKAHHDVGVSGLNIEQKRRLIEILKPHGKVFITTERNIDEEFKQYQLTVSPEKVHSFMFYAQMLIGDSQTMTSEAAVLGVPSLRCNSFAGRISYLEEQEKKYELTYAFLPNDFEKMEEKLIELLNIPDLKAEWISKRQKMLADKIYPTPFFQSILENHLNGSLQTKNIDFKKFK